MSIKALKHQNLNLMNRFHLWNIFEANVVQTQNPNDHNFHSSTKFFQSASEVTPIQIQSGQQSDLSLGSSTQQLILHELGENGNVTSILNTTSITNGLGAFQFGQTSNTTSTTSNTSGFTGFESVSQRDAFDRIGQRRNRRESSGRSRIWLPKQSFGKAPLISGSCSEFLSKLHK